MRGLQVFALAALVAATVGATVGGCVTDGSYQWVDELSAGELKPPPYKVQLGDRLVINVWNQPPLSGEVLVRPDGNITLPLVGDVAAVGLTPSQVGDEVGKRLNGLVVDPHVTVALASTHEPVVSVVGEVKGAGAFPLRSGEGVLELLARAGGLSEFAQKDRIFVIRKSDQLRVRFDFGRLSRADGAGVDFVLQDGDVIVVE